jgi:uncharacterized membrane protein
MMQQRRILTSINAKAYLFNSSEKNYTVTTKPIDFKLWKSIFNDYLLKIQKLGFLIEEAKLLYFKQHVVQLLAACWSNILEALFTTHLPYKSLLAIIH